MKRARQEGEEEERVEPMEAEPAKKDMARQSVYAAWEAEMARRPKKGTLGCCESILNHYADYGLADCGLHTRTP